MAKGGGKVPSKTASQADVGAFLEKVRLTPVGKKTCRPGRLLFAMDATASRKPTWDMAARIQGEMFQETAALGGLEIQLAYYRGFGEFKAGQWTVEEKVLLGQMTSVFCLAGVTHIERCSPTPSTKPGSGKSTPWSSSAIVSRKTLTKWEKLPANWG